MKIDVYRELRLPKPVTGLIHKITSPKGIRKYLEETQSYKYRLHVDPAIQYEFKPVDLDSGLYWVVDLHRNKDSTLCWNQYLVDITEDDAQIVGSYLNQKNSDWIVEALPTIKKYFR